MRLVERAAGDDGSWTLVDFEETRVAGGGVCRPFYTCIIPSYRSFNPYDRSNSPYSIVFQPKLAPSLLV